MYYLLYYVNMAKENATKFLHEILTDAGCKRGTLTCFLKFVAPRQHFLSLPLSSLSACFCRWLDIFLDNKANVVHIK